MSIPLKKRGQVEIELGDRKTVLEATFENIALFEQTSGIGIYVAAHRFGTGDIRMTDLANIIWSFSADRDKDGWKKADIGKVIIAGGPDIAIQIATNFLVLMFGVDEEDKSEDTQKKTVTRRKPRS